jgi:hypothetical protein
MKTILILALSVPCAALAACGPRTETPVETAQPAPKPGNVGDRVVCVEAGKTVYDDFGENIRFNEGSFSYLSWTTGKYAAAVGQCFGYQGVSKPMDWSATMPGLVGGSGTTKGASATTDKPAAAASAPSPKTEAPEAPASAKTDASA